MSDTFGMIIWVFLIAAVVIVVIGQRKNKKKYEGQSMKITKDWYEVSQSKYVEEDIKRAYFFDHDENFLNTGHRLVDRNHKVVYEAKILYGDPLHGYEMDITNYLINYTHHHNIGAEISTHYDFDGMGMAVDSYFKFDGINIWEYLESLGYTYQFELFGLAYKVHVSKNGKSAGTIYSSNHGKNYFDCYEEIEPKVGDHWYYVVECSTKDLDAMFLLAMAFARCELSMRNLK